MTVTSKATVAPVHDLRPVADDADAVALREDLELVPVVLVADKLGDPCGRHAQCCLVLEAAQGRAEQSGANLAAGPAAVKPLSHAPVYFL